MKLLTKNDKIEIQIDAISAEGSGIGRYEGIAVFVAGTVVGDRIIAHIIKAKKSYAVGRIEQVLEPSPHHIASDCAVSTQCGGCVFRHMEYEEECRAKWTRVNDALHRIGKLELTANPLIAAEQITHYRNKAQYPIALENGVAKIGFYAPRSHRIVPCENCVLQPKEFVAGLKAVRTWALAQGVTSYEEESNVGLLRHIYFRKGFGTKQIMACLVLNGTDIPAEGQLVALLQEALPTLCSIVLNFNTERTNVILGKHSKTIWGDAYITDVLLGLQFRISPNSFYQVNHQQTEILYSLVSEYAALTKEDTVVDFYCGAGTIGLTLAKEAKAVIGVEVIHQAVENAVENAKINGITNATFLCMDATQGAQELQKQKKTAHVVVLDPPRKGCEANLIEAVVSLAPDRIVYVSCDPATLARDLAIFETQHYHAVKATPIDLFPRTAHVETVCLLSKLR